MKHQTVINIYNFIRKSHEEPSRFLQDDFDTVRKQLELIKQYGFPGTYALKYDALMDDRYLDLIREFTDLSDEIGAWWEITGELCQKAGVEFRGQRGETFDNRVNSAYSLGYHPWERCALIDAYMKDFKEQLGYYPETIGSWVIDIVTLTHSHDRYGTKAAAICRDQMATDGFTLWGGYVNGVYYPSRRNEYLPASSPQEQLNMPVFRLLGPDPIRCFEEQVRESVKGVCSLEPSCIEGRNPSFITWMFERLIQEDTVGMAYAQVGQENNFLWENMKTGLTIQMEQLYELAAQEKIQIETMADTAERFATKYRLTPPITFNASVDYEENSSLKTMWYACRNYRISFLAEDNEIFIRDWFVYRDSYESRYLKGTMEGEDSIFDALPLMFPQIWKTGNQRAKVKLLDQDGQELKIKDAVFTKDGEDTGLLIVKTEGREGEAEGRIYMQEEEITFRGEFSLYFTTLPVLTDCKEGKLFCIHNGFSYSIEVISGQIADIKDTGVLIHPEHGIIRIKLTESRKLVCSYQDREEDKEGTYSFWQPAYTKRPEEFEKLFKLKAYRAKEHAVARKQIEPVMEATDYLWKDEIRRQITIKSDTNLDSRKVFNKEGAAGLLRLQRGSTDYQDGNWLGTVECMDVTLHLEREEWVKEAVIGFITHHRAGIIYPRCVSAYLPDAEGSMIEEVRIELPQGPFDREIEKKDIILPINRKIKEIRIVAEPFERFPNWCCYRGLSGVFTMADNIILY